MKRRKGGRASGNLVVLNVSESMAGSADPYAPLWTRSFTRPDGKSFVCTSGLWPSVWRSFSTAAQNANSDAFHCIACVSGLCPSVFLDIIGAVEHRLIPVSEPTAQIVVTLEVCWCVVP